MAQKNFGSYADNAVMNILGGIPPRKDPEQKPEELANPVRQSEPVSEETSAVPAAPEPEAPAAAEIQEDAEQTAPATVKTGTKRGRPSKTAKVSEKEPKKSAEKEVTTIHFPPDTLQRLRILHVLEKQSISVLVESCCDDMLNRSYVCHNPACNCKFSISEQNGVAPKPSMCPACGSDKVRPKKLPF